jgi:hypothetical protein
MKISNPFLLVPIILATACVALGDTITGAGAPVGVGATTTELLYTQPILQTSSGTRVVESVTISGGVGTFSTFSVLPDQIGSISSPATTSSENYLAISPGLGGFTPGAVYVSAVVNSQNVIVSVPGNTVFATLPSGSAPTNQVGVTFDSVGTFGNALIVTTSAGVFGYNSAGILLFSYPSPLPAGTAGAVESATVAPLTFSACPGCLLIVVSSASGSGAGFIFSVFPGTPSGTPWTLVSAAAPAGPEGISFVSPSPNTFDGYAYFATGFTNTLGENYTSSNGVLLAFTAAQLASITGQFLIPDEATGNIYAWNGISFTVFSATGYQLEGGTIVGPGSAAPVPEPATLALLGLGSTALIGAMRRRKRR